MRVGITGSSGLIGNALRTRLESDGHEVVRFIRGRSGDPQAMWDPAAGWVRPGALEGLDAIVHLAGESIGNGRWSEARKRTLRASRIDSTRLLVGEISRMSNPPAFISASAIGVYGDRKDELLDESSSKGGGFLADLTADWESEAMKAADAGARTVILRLGVVLSKEGGALPRLQLPFKLGAGGRLGSGRQWFSWVALDDVIAAMVRTITTDMSGVYNVTAPQPVTNRELTSTLSRVLRRPALFPVPRFALRIVVGESADELLMFSQRVMPRRLQESGFTFQYPDLDGALRAILKGVKTSATASSNRSPISANPHR